MRRAYAWGGRRREKSVGTLLCAAELLLFAGRDGLRSNYREVEELLVIQTIIGSLGIMYFRPILGVLVIIGLFIYTLIYKYMCDKEFGGVTGDTAGFFVAVSEEVMLVILAIGSILL